MIVNRKIIFYLFLALLAGVALGYFLFGNSVDNHVHDGHNQTTETIVDNNNTGKDEIWTCSMHPQIRQNEFGDCPICGMDLIPLSENTSDDPLVLEMTPEAVKLSNIQTSLVGQSDGQSGSKMNLSGKIQADERLASSQVAHVPGRIEKLFVSFTGERVKKGQRIATIYAPELITAQRELLEAIKLQDLNPGLLEVARNKLKYWKIGDAVIKSVEESGTIKNQFDIYADQSGVVSELKIAVGDYVNQGQVLFDLMNLQKVWVLFDAYEKDLSIINVGDQITFTTPAIANKTFKTKVKFIDPVINPATRIASIRAEINNYNGALKPEMLVYGTLQQKTSKGSGITVPKTAVLWTGERSVVYVKVPDSNVPSYQFREVQMGKSLGNTYQVLSGLEIGEEVVTYGNFTIDAAAQLNNQASMMNRNVKVKNDVEVAVLPDYTETTPDAFMEQIADLSAAYLVLKDALVASDQQAANINSGKVADAINKVDMNLIEDEVHRFWMKQLTALKAHNNKIKVAKGIEEQRQQFDFLSQTLINTIKVFGITDDTLYVQHCPMANNNEGADWLSSEEEIRNPYYGDKMLKCGLVKSVIE